MPVLSATFDAIPESQASLGRAGDEHTVIVDRPAGVAGGQGRGLNGGQLLALAVGGCLCNDLRYLAAEHAVDLGAFGIDVDVNVEAGDVTAVHATIRDAERPDLIVRLLPLAEEASTIVRAVRSGAPVTITHAAAER
ncbi:MAG: OsmC family protein [Solirubrobacteraceae bacterium]|nr:OsmC family protein [Solirubrobacteraceae bacterium]